MRLHWSPVAEWQLYEIGDYIARDDPEVALRWVRKLRDRARKISRMPRAGRPVPEYEDEAIREVFVKNYRIVYRIDPDVISIVAVLEGHAQLPPLEDDE